MLARKRIKEFLTSNGPSTREEITAYCLSNGIKEKRIDIVIDLLHQHSKLTKNGDDYTIS